MTNILHLKSLEDIEIMRAAILNGEEFEIGEIAPIEYSIKLTGGRFSDYDPLFINADVAEIIVNEQKNYDKFTKEIEHKFDVDFANEAKELKFKLEKGSLEFIDANVMLQVVKKMSSGELMYGVLGLVAMWLTRASYSDKIKKDIVQIEKSIEASDNKESREHELKLKTLDVYKELELNKPLQDASNNHTKGILQLLRPEELLIVNNKELTHEDTTNYDYMKPIVDDIEPEPEIKEYEIESYNFTKPGKLFKFVGVAMSASSDVLDPKKRMELLRRAEERQTVKLKVKITQDGVSKKVVSMYILDLVDIA